MRRLCSHRKARCLMGRMSVFVALALMLGCLMPGCRATQQNMNDAYRIAVAGRDQANEDSTIYMKYRKAMRHGDMVVAGDTVDVSIQYVNVTEGGGGVRESLKRYCVVVAQFKNEFNARSMRERLAAGGWPGAFVVETSEPYYFVVAEAYHKAEEAVATLHSLAKDGSLHMKSPCPFILEPSQLRR